MAAVTVCSDFGAQYSFIHNSNLSIHSKKKKVYKYTHTYVQEYTSICEKLETTNGRFIPLDTGKQLKIMMKISA